MREIKFRAWDKDKKQMYAMPTLREVCEQDGFASKHLIFMLSTNLKDKNGKEIFESDLVKVIKTGYIGKILWEEGSFWMDDIPIGELIWDNESCLEIEIIGNIYESKELLEV